MISFKTNPYILSKRTYNTNMYILYRHIVSRYFWLVMQAIYMRYCISFEAEIVENELQNATKTCIF